MVIAALVIGSSLPFKPFVEPPARRGGGGPEVKLDGESF
jgi:hypothetical protein